MHYVPLAGRGTMVMASHGQIFMQSVQPVQTSGSTATLESKGFSLLRTKQLSHGATAIQASQPVHWSKLTEAIRGDFFRGAGVVGGVAMKRV